jgi:N-acylneuraminate cytidylyltransferase
MPLIAIIPARGGSKRIPRKNIRPFCGRPMIAYPLAAARESGLFEVIHVSTEDPDVTATAESLGFPVAFPRPAELADDHVGIFPVLRHAVEAFAARGRQFDAVCMIAPCSPLLEAADLAAAAALFRRHGGKKLVLAVATYPAPVEWAFRLAADGGLTAEDAASHAKRSQDLPPAYYDAGTFSIHPIGDFAPGADIAGRASVGYVLPRRKAVDIDTPEDWEIAETLYRGHRAARDGD